MLDIDTCSPWIEEDQGVDIMKPSFRNVSSIHNTGRVEGDQVVDIMKPSLRNASGIQRAGRRGLECASGLSRAFTFQFEIPLTSRTTSWIVASTHAPTCYQTSAPTSPQVKHQSKDLTGKNIYTYLSS